MVCSRILEEERTTGPSSLPCVGLKNLLLLMMVTLLTPPPPSPPTQWTPSYSLNATIGSTCALLLAASSAQKALSRVVVPSCNSSVISNISSSEKPSLNSEAEGDLLCIYTPPPRTSVLVFLLLKLPDLFCLYVYHLSLPLNLYPQQNVDYVSSTQINTWHCY